MKKLLMIYIIICLLTNMTFAVSAVSVPVSKYTGTDTAAMKKISDLGLCELGAESELVTRGNLAIILSQLLSLDSYDNNSQIYSDVTTDDKAFFAVNSLNKIKVVDTAEYFLPHQPITGYQILKMLINAMGYKELAEAKGGFPYGYITVANSINIPVLNSETITYKELAQVLEASIEKEIYVLDNIGKSFHYINNGSTILSLYHNIFVVNGIFSQLGIMSINSSAELDANKALIAGVTINTGAFNPYDLLGYKVKAYYMDSDNEKTLKYIEEGKNQKQKLISKYIKDYSSNQITYSGYDIKEKNINIPNSIDAMINDMWSYGFEKNDILSADEIILIDNNDDGKYDLMKIYKYEIAVISGVDYNKNLLYFKYLISYGDSISTEINKNLVTITDIDNNTMDIVEIQDNSIATIMCSRDNKIINIKMSEKMIAGVVSEISESNDEQVIIVSDKEYTFSKNINSNPYYKDIKAGVSYLFSLDSFGKIADIELDGLTNTQYGFLSNVMIADTIDSEVKFLLFLPNSGLKTVIGNDTIEIDGNVLKDSSKILKALFYDSTGSQTNKFVPKPVKYRLNKDGKLTWLDTPRVCESEINSNVDLELYSKFKSGKYNYETHIFGGQLRVDSKTVVLCVPIAESDLEDENCYFVKDLTYLQKRTYPNSNEKIEAYEVSKDITAKLIVLYQKNAGGQNVEKYTPLTIIKKITRAINEDGIIVNKIYGLQAGKEVTIIADEKFDEKMTKYYKDSDKNPVPSTLNIGDIIRVSTNSKGCMIDYDKIFSLTDADDPAIVLKGNEYGVFGVKETHPSLLAVSSGAYSQNQRETTRVFSHNNENNLFYGVEFYACYGKVSDKVGSEVFISGKINQTQNFVEFCDTSKVKIITIDEILNKVSFGTIDELRSIKDYGEDGASEVIYSSFSGKSACIIAIKRKQAE